MSLQLNTLKHPLRVFYTSSSSSSSSFSAAAAYHTATKQQRVHRARIVALRNRSTLSQTFAMLGGSSSSPMEKKRKIEVATNGHNQNGEATTGAGRAPAGENVENGKGNNTAKKQQTETQTRHQPSKERVGLRYPYKGGDYVPEIPKELSLATPERIEASWEFFRKMGSPKYHVAPMVDQSELAYRMLCRKYGATCAYTPMLHARLFTETEKYRKEHFTTCAEDKPLLTQFCANDPQVLLEAAKHIEDRTDAVDINFGCPQRIAKRGNYGAFLMDDMDLAHRLVSTLAKGLKIPVTCKIRVFPDRERTLKYAKLMQDSGCMLLAVHGRTREQKNCREIRADWGIIKEVKELLDIPVLANGNIRHIQDADDCIAFTGCDGVLSAEPLLLNPALFSREKKMDVNGVPILPEQPCDMLLEYLDLCEKYPTPQRMVRAHVHKLLGSWFNVFPDVRIRMNNEVSTLDMYRKVALEMKELIQNHTKEKEEA